MQNKLCVILFCLFCSACFNVKNKSNENYIDGYTIINEISDIEKYNRLFSKLMPFNFEIKNNKLNYFKISFNKKTNKFEKVFKKISFVKYIKKYYNNEKDFNIWLIVYFKNVNSYRYYNAYVSKGKIIINEYINNINNKDYLKYILDEYKYKVNSYDKNLDILEKPIEELNLDKETIKINDILNESLVKNIKQKIIFMNDKFFIILGENNYSNAYFLLWKNNKELIKNPEIMIKNCKVFYSGSANNTNYICINGNYIYNVSINYVSHPNVPKYEFSIYKNNKVNISEIDDDNFYIFLENSEKVLQSQELDELYTNK